MVEAPASRQSAIAHKPDGPDALHEHAVARTKRGALANVHRRQQTAAAADVVVDADRIGKPRDADAGLEVDVLRPAAEQTLARRIGDAVDAPGRTSRRRAMNGTGSALTARPMDVEEDGPIAFDAGSEPSSPVSGPRIDSSTRTTRARG